MTDTDHRLRVGLIGAGGIAGVHTPGWTSLGADLTIYSHVGAAALAAEHGAREVGSLDELWPLVDLVDIVTPTDTHAEIALAAIDAGKHVMCEKPLARTSAQAQEVIDAAASAGVHIYPAHVVRYFPAYAAAHAAVTAGQIGPVAVNRFRRMSSGPPGAWFFDIAASGGIVMDLLIHDLDQAVWLSGPVSTVFARSHTRTDDGRNTASAHVILAHESGAISHVYGVWGHENLPFQTSFDIAGELGVLRYDSTQDDSIRLDLPAQDSRGYLPATEASTSPYTAELADFAQAIVTGSATRVTGADGVTAVRLTEAANESIRTGRVITITAEGAHR